MPVGRLTVGSPSSSLAIAIAIDTSQSMRGRPLADALGAAQSFLGRLRPADSVAVIGFGHRAEVVQGMTRARTRCARRSARWRSTASRAPRSTTAS